MRLADWPPREVMDLGTGATSLRRELGGGHGGGALSLPAAVQADIGQVHFDVTAPVLSERGDQTPFLLRARRHGDLVRGPCA